MGTESAAQHGPDVFVREARVCVEEIGLRRAIGELAKDGLDRDAGATHYGYGVEERLPS